MSQTTGLVSEVKNRTAWSMFMGVLITILGVFLIAYPLFTATVTTVLLGWVFIFAGVAEVIFALHSTTPGNFFLKLLLGIVYGIAGIFLAAAPLVGVAALTLLLGALFLIQAGMVTALAFEVRPAEGWGWFLFDGIIAFAVGVLIFAKWPWSSLWAIGTLVGVAILMRGIARIVVAARIHKGASDVDRFERAA
jgi:uncharacterized membrane protein HdeD (DUF308 family)